MIRCTKNVGQLIAINTKKNVSNKLLVNILFNNIINNNFAATYSSGSRNEVTNIVKSFHGEVEIPEISLTKYVLRNYQNYADKPAISCGVTDRSYDYKTLTHLTYQFAKGLLAIRGCNLKSGDTIGIVLPNIPEYAPCIYGALEAGLKVTFANPLYTPDEIYRQFKMADVKLLVTIPQFEAVLGNVLKNGLQKYRGTVSVGGSDNLGENIFSFKTLVAANHKVELPEINSEDVAIIPFSSGTSGLPKGVLLSHFNCVANLQQLSHPAISKFTNPEYLNHCDVIFSIPPFFHIYGFNGVLNLALKDGSHLVSIPKFTPEDYIKTLVKYRPTVLFVVPSLLLFLASHPLVTSDMLKSVEQVVVGAAAATIQVQEKFKNKCGKDVLIIHGYGMTESSPVTLIGLLKSLPNKGSSVGHLTPSTEARIVSVTDGKICGPNKSGEIHFKGPQVMKGYLNNKEATEQTLDQDGWLKTGDVAYYDDDKYFYIVDRTKELIKVKGNQVSPTELENIIMELPEVADVAVAGIPDEYADELPRAYVVLKQGASLEAEIVANHVKSKCVKHKWLAGGVKFISIIPRNPNGKVIRNDLKFLDENIDV